MNDWVRSVLRGTVGRETLEIRKDAAQLAKGGLGAVSGGLIGNLPMGQQQGGVDQNGIARRPESGVSGPQAGMNQSTQRFMQQFGQGGGAPQGQQGGLMGFLGGLGDRLAGIILPSEQMVNRLKNGAAALAATGASIVAAGSALTQDDPLPPAEKPIVTATAPAEPAAVAVSAPAEPVVASPVSAGEANTSRPLDTTSPAIVTPVAATAAFAVAAAPAVAAPAPLAPEVQAAPAAEFKSRHGDDVYARAQAFVRANNGPSPGPS